MDECKHVKLNAEVQPQNTSGKSFFVLRCDQCKTIVTAVPNNNFEGNIHALISRLEQIVGQLAKIAEKK